MTQADWDAVRDTAPIDAEHLWRYLRAFYGITINARNVCEHHQALFDPYVSLILDRPRQLLWLGSRGCGKSAGQGLIHHLMNRHNPAYRSRVIGGSLQQSKQIHGAISDYVWLGAGGWGGSDRDTIETFLTTKATYRNGSEFEILTGSTKSARGPHVPLVGADEVDEMKPAILNAAAGMAQEDTRRGYKTTFVMTSTYHNTSGLMYQQMESAKEHGSPFFTTCVFEALEWCPPERSGPNLGKCPECPIQRWCWEDIHGYGRGLPKAKRANGHYSIETFIQKVGIVDIPTLEADYLCKGPRVAGLWFPEFSRENIVHLFGPVPGQDTHLHIDPGPHTGAVAFQPLPAGTLFNGKYLAHDSIYAFLDYYIDRPAARRNARDVREKCESFGVWKPPVIGMDPAAKSDTSGIGITGFQEWSAEGLAPTRWWVNAGKRERLTVLSSLICSADGTRRLFVSSACTHLISALERYKRKFTGGSWADMPADPQHPEEELIDSLAGGVKSLYPRGLDAPRPRGVRLPPNRR